MAESDSKLVFISHASRDAASAETVCDGLERRGIPCWISTRHIAAGEDWGDAIARGLDQTLFVVALISAHSVASDYVNSEITIAKELRRTILPLRLDPTPLSGGLKLKLVNAQWFDAFGRPWEDTLTALADIIRGGILAAPSEPPPAPIEDIELKTWDEWARRPGGSRLTRWLRGLLDER